MRTYEKEHEKQEYMQGNVKEREREGACDRGAKERRSGIEDECTHSR